MVQLIKLSMKARAHWIISNSMAQLPLLLFSLLPLTAHGDSGLLLQPAGRPPLHVPRPRPGGGGEAGEPGGPRLLQTAGPLPHRHG